MKFGSPSSYTLPIVLAIIVHAIGALLLFSQWPDFNKKKLPPVPKFITASVIQEQNQIVKKQQEKKRRQVVREKKRKQEAKKRKLKQEAEKKKKRLLAQKKRAQAIEKAKRLEKQKKLEAKKRLAQKKRQAQQKKLAEKKKLEKAKKLAEEKKRVEEEKQRRDWEQELLEQAAIEVAEQKQQEAEEAERKKLEEAKQAERRAGIKADFADQIYQRVKGMWNYSHGTNPNSKVRLKVDLMPTGEVVGVKIVESSGNALLDRSVERAIYSASPLPVPKDSVLFEREFRRFNMIFRPGDAVL